MRKPPTDTKRAMNVLLSSPASQDELLADHTPAARQSAEEEGPPSGGCPFGLLTAFVAEHQRCGDLDGGRDNGYIWLQCSCGGLIMHPGSEPPPAPARTEGGTAR